MRTTLLKKKVLIACFSIILIALSCIRILDVEKLNVYASSIDTFSETTEDEENKDSIKLKNNDIYLSNNGALLYSGSSARSENIGIISGTDTHTLLASDLTDAMYIPNSNYFLINPWHHNNDGSDNAGGTCTTVAMQMLIGYHNYYSDRRLIPSNGNGRTFLDADYGNLNGHPALSRTTMPVGGQGCLQIGTADGVYQGIFDATWISDWTGIGQAVGLVTRGAGEFLNANTQTVSWQLSSNFFSAATARADIDAGRPIVLGMNQLFQGNFHVVPAYGYAKLDGVDGFLVHYGWGASRTQVWVPESWFGFQIRMSVDHDHTLVDSGNIINDTHRQLDCTTCGYSTLDSLYEITNSTITGVKYPLLGNITIPDSIDVYSQNTASFTTQTITNIGSGAFVNQSGITMVTLPSTVISIGDIAFKNCTNLTTIQSLNSIQIIEMKAFEGCNLLASINIPSGLTSIGNGVFSGCNNLNISVSSSNPNYTAEGNILYNKTKSAVIASGDVSPNLTIPNTITTINPHAFEGNGNLEVVSFDGVPAIGSYAFADCINLDSVYFDSYSVTATMGSNCFTDTDTILYVPFNAQNIYKSVFADHSYYVDSIQVLITYIDNGSTIGTESFYHGSTIAGLLQPQKTGYTFSGWYDNVALIGEAYENGDLLNKIENTALYAKWTPLSFVITLDPNGGILNGSNTINAAYGNSFSTEATATRVGYTLDGWYDSAGVRYMTAEGESTRLWDKLENTTLYAHWTVKSYEIQINGNGSVTWLGASGLSDNPCTIPYGTILNAINLVPRFKVSVHGFKEGHIFDHFEYANGDWDWTSIPDLGENGSVITITPVWVAEVHRIYFNTLCSITVQYIEEAFDSDIALPNITRSGFVFDGWYPSSTVGVRVNWTKMPDLTPTTQNNGSIALYARWIPLYTITFNSNGGSTCLSQTGTEGEEITLPTSSKGGYKGIWCYENKLEYGFGSTYIIGTSNITLTASWQEKLLSECYNSYSSSYEIWTYNQLNSVRNYRNSNHKLMASITIPENVNWSPISSYYGIFNGNNNTITNLKIIVSGGVSATTYLGLFGVNYGTIDNLNLTGINISLGVYHAQPCIYVGGIAGRNEGTISYVNVSGSLVCDRNVSALGGIVGYNHYGTIRRCTANNITMYGNGDMGGIVGSSCGGLITYCSTSSFIGQMYIVTTNRSMGGIAGYIYGGGVIEYCHNINAQIKFVDYTDIAWNQIAPKMGIIVGAMDGSTIRNVSVTSATFNYGVLPEKDNNGWFLNSWYYPRRFIGAFGNGACGSAVNNYTITNTSWTPSSGGGGSGGGGIGGGGSHLIEIAMQNSIVDPIGETAVAE